MVGLLNLHNYIGQFLIRNLFFSLYPIASVFLEQPNKLSKSIVIQKWVENGLCPWMPSHQARQTHCKWNGRNRCFHQRFKVCRGMSPPPLHLICRSGLCKKSYGSWWMLADCITAFPGLWSFSRSRAQYSSRAPQSSGHFSELHYLWQQYNWNRGSESCNTLNALVRQRHTIWRKWFLHKFRSLQHQQSVLRFRGLRHASISP